MRTLPQREGTAVPHDDLLDCRAVCAMLGGIDPATLYRGIRKGRYPAPIKVGPNISRWLRTEVAGALAAMIAGRAGL
jgi:predicted DNA-binding transcriptional regulator AlpA